MPEIQGFWDVGPHETLPVEATWTAFVRSQSGISLEDELPRPRRFENADFLFPDACVVAELKEVQTEFSHSPAFVRKHQDLLARLARSDPSWRPALLGGPEKYPPWFGPAFYKLFRPQLQRVLKKANAQLKATKEHFGIVTNTGVLILVNDAFVSIGPGVVRALLADILLHQYSSIDCCIYVTVNRYVEIPDSNVPRLVWAPCYSEKAPDYLVSFVDQLGNAWFKHLENLIGPFTETHEGPDLGSWIERSRAIVVPST